MFKIEFVDAKNVVPGTKVPVVANPRATYATVFFSGALLVKNSSTQYTKSQLEHSKKFTRRVW